MHYNVTKFSSSLNSLAVLNVEIVPVIATPNNQVSFYLCWIQDKLKRWKVPNIMIINAKTTHIINTPEFGGLYKVLLIKSLNCSS